RGGRWRGALRRLPPRGHVARRADGAGARHRQPLAARSAHRGQFWGGPDRFGGARCRLRAGLDGGTVRRGALRPGADDAGAGGVLRHRDRRPRPCRRRYRRCRIAQHQPHRRAQGPVLRLRRGTRDLSGITCAASVRMRTERAQMHSGPDIVAVMVGVAVEGPYSYRVPEGMAVERGSIVAVPLGPRLILGVVWGPPQDMIAHNRLRDIAHVYAVPPLSGELLQLVEWVARYTLAAPGQVLRGVLRAPEALDAPRPVTAFRRTGYEPEKLTPARLRVLDTLADDAVWTRPALLGAAGVSA